MYTRSWKKLVAISILSFAAFASAQQTLGPVVVTAPPPIPTIPPVTATAPRIGGGPTIICRGSACAAFLDGLKAQYNPENFVSEGMLEDGVPVPGPQFCTGLKALKPNGCSSSNPPPSPGIFVPGKPAWQPNGCGTGGAGDWFQDLALELLAGQAYSGNLNSPYAGVSFQNACDGHDQCWASGGNKGECDSNFGNNMQNACSQLGGSAGNSCSGFASLYHGIVSTVNGAGNAYASSMSSRACAVWANDMRENSCAN